MMTRRNLVSRVALGAASFAAASGLSQFMSVPALAADGPRDDTTDDNIRSERRQDRREQRRRERRQEKQDQEQNQTN